MTDSNATKQAMADALKELMHTLPFEKISVSHICEKCNMNRKSFYYHFKDKYDLVNWIFDIECISVLTEKDATDRWTLFEILIHYFYENRKFYQKIIKVKGQNSFSEHFREFLYPIMRKRLDDIVEPSVKHDFMISFLSDACICAIERWLSDKECMSPDRFMHIIKSLTESIALSLCSEIN